MESSRRRLLIGGLATLLAAQCLYGILTLATLYKSYKTSLVSVQAIASEKFSLDLSRLARFGKDPERVEDMAERVRRFCEIAGVSRLAVLDGKGRSIAAWPSDASEAPPVLQDENKLKTLHGEVKTFDADGKVWIVQPIRNRTGADVGSVLAGFDEAGMTALVGKAASMHALLFLGVAVLGGSLFILLVLREGKPPFPRLGKGCLIIPLLVSQIAFLFFLRGPVVSFLEENARDAGTQLARYIGHDVAHINDLGLKLADVPSVRTYLDHIRQSLPWAQAITVSDAGGTTFTAGNPRTPLQAGVPLSADIPVSVTVGIDESTVWEAFRSIVYDTLTIMIIAMLFMLELVPLQGVGQAAAPSAGDPLPPRIMRPIIFLCMFAIDLPASFIPLRIAEMDLGLLGLPPDVVMGLPLSFEMCAVGIGILIGSFWSQKRGWRPLLLWGALLVALGNVASGLVSDSLAYILSRGGAGFGYGLINLAGQVFVVSHSSPEHRAGNLSALVAGLYAGFLCGSAFGGLIADNLGYASAFLVSAGLMAIIGIFLHFALPREAWTPEPSASGRISLRGLGAFFSDIKMAGLLLGNIFPCAFVTVCLFQFFLPVSLSQAGVSPAGIGRVFLLFCLVIIYLGPFFGRAVDKSPNKLVWLVGGGFLCIGGIIALLLLDGLAAAFACVALLALCNAIVASAQGTYALEIPVSRQVGSGRTVGIYNITERLGQMLGPVALGQVIALWGVNSGLLGMAAVLAVLNILFALTGRLAKAGA